MAKKPAARQTLRHEDLVEILLALPEKQLKGVALLRERHRGGSEPSQDALVEATKELVAYAEASAGMASALSGLDAVAAVEDTLVEGYPL